MIKKLGKKNLIQIAVCLVLIVAVAIPLGLTLKKANLENNVGAVQVTDVAADNYADQNDIEAEAAIVPAEAEIVEEEPVEQIAMIDDGIYRGTAVSEESEDESVTVTTENMAANEAGNGALSITGVENTSEEAAADDQTESTDNAETIVDEENQIVLLSFDEETIVKRIDGAEEKTEVKEEPKKENTITYTGISQSDDVAKKSKELVCKYNPAMDITLSDEEYEILCRIVEAEAGDQDIYGRILVANVILNRTQYWEFPDTVTGVVFQVNSKGAVQFSPISDGSFYRVKVSKKTKKAVNSALSGDDYSDGALYFFMRSGTTTAKASWFDSLEFVLQYGCHEFFK